MRLLFALPGFHRYERGAEVALLSVAAELARTGDDVTVIGSGEAREGDPYKFIHAGSIRRENFEKFPFIPLFRSETVYEEASFAPALALKYKPQDYDAVLTCSFPFTNRILGRPILSGQKPLNIFVTQNGEWPAVSNDAEYRFFSCDGLVCTNPDYFESNKDRWKCAIIPNGISTDRFRIGVGDRRKFGFPLDRKIVLMVSALIPTKRVIDGIRAVAPMDDTHLVVAGDGPMRDEVKALAAELLPNRFTQLTVTPDQMPSLYQSADVFLHLSLLESFGNVFPEAMACGLPIIGHDTPRLRWIVGDDEYLVNTEDNLAVTQALKDAIADKSAAPATVSERAKSFAWSNIAAQYRSFLSELMSKRD
ncbi:MAG: glycosyltransferase family 4 protein [Parasphingorhabdus sp.]|uniref:glycosyltransferase family 4 protein n=1 Tax=Parasphingorhabdus sp. TaxID=2709688 RepID=UPI003298BE6A